MPSIWIKEPQSWIQLFDEYKKGETLLKIPVSVCAAIHCKKFAEKYAINSDDLYAISAPEHFENMREYTALWDTGASMSFVTRQVVEECKLPFSRETDINFASGREKKSTYHACISFGDTLAFPRIEVAEMNPAIDIDVLIGLDIIGKGDFVIESKNGSIKLYYKYPSEGGLVVFDKMV